MFSPDRSRNRRHRVDTELQIHCSTEAPQRLWLFIFARDPVPCGSIVYSLKLYISLIAFRYKGSNGGIKGSYPLPGGSGRLRPRCVPGSVQAASPHRETTLGGPKDRKQAFHSKRLATMTHLASKTRISLEASRNYPSKAP